MIVLNGAILAHDVQFGAQCAEQATCERDQVMIGLINAIPCIIISLLYEAT